MKKLIFFSSLICSLFLASAVFAVSTTPARTEKTGGYVCPKCHSVSAKEGKCDKCKVATVKAGTYYCEGCGATSEKAKKCSMCNKDMVMVTPTPTPVSKGTPATAPAPAK